MEGGVSVSAHACMTVEGGKTHGKELATIGCTCTCTLINCEEERTTKHCISGRNNALKMHIDAALSHVRTWQPPVFQ